MRSSLHFFSEDFTADSYSALLFFAQFVDIYILFFGFVFTFLLRENMLDKRVVDSRLDQAEDVRGKPGKNISFVHVVNVLINKEDKKRVT